MSATRFKWAYPALTLLAIFVLAALSHQSEGQRLRQAEQDNAAHLKSDLERAYDLAVALQSASTAPPRLSPAGDTVIFSLPVTTAGRVDELRLFVDPTRGGLWMERGHQRAEQVATTVDGFSAALDARSDGRPVLWMEFSASLSRAGDPPLRHHLYRSILLDSGTDRAERG